jgi:hypothetical protein
MNTQTMASLLEANAKSLAAIWLEEVKKTDYMNTYRALADGLVMHRGYHVYLMFIKWLQAGADDKDIAIDFEAIGIQRYKENFPLSEVMYALYLTKKVFWEFLITNEEVKKTFDMNQSPEVISVFNNYFDLGNFFIVRGYLNELSNHLNETETINKDELQKILVKGGLSKETEKKASDQLYSSGFKIGVIY